MDRSTILTEAARLLARAGFYVAPISEGRPMLMDLVARRDDEVWMLKALVNVDGLDEATAGELLRLAGALQARVFVIGHHSGQAPLEPGVVYQRHGIPVLRPETLDEWLLQGTPPYVVAAPGGYYVQINGAALRAAREAGGYSLGDVSQAVGVSRRAIQMYETGMRALVDVAIRLEQFLQAPLAEPVPVAIPPLPPSVEVPSLGTPAENTTLRWLTRQGWQVVPTRRAPFHAVATAEESHLTIAGMDEPSIAARARLSGVIARVAERRVFAVLHEAKHPQLEGVPVVSRQEMRRAAGPDELKALIRERVPRATDET